MRVRVPVAVRNRLLRLEGVRPVNLPMGGWPPIMDLDEWEALASAMQDKLAASARDVLQPTAERRVAVEPAVRKADDGAGKPRELSAVEEYLLAQREAREGHIARISFGQTPP